MLHNCGTAAHTPCRKAGEQDACTARPAPGVEPLLGGTGGGASGAGAAGGRHGLAQSAAAQPPAAAGGPEPAGHCGAAPAGERPPDRAGVHGGGTAGLCAGLPERQPERCASAGGARRVTGDLCGRGRGAGRLLHGGGAGPLPTGTDGVPAPAGGYPIPGVVGGRTGAHHGPVRAGAGGLFRGDDRRGAGPLWPRQPGAGTFGGRSPRLSDRNGRGRRCAAGPPGRGAGRGVGCFLPPEPRPAARGPAAGAAVGECFAADRPDRTGP